MSSKSDPEREGGEVVLTNENEDANGQLALSEPPRPLSGNIERERERERE
eukprot:CAMPEP_0184654710 /NCGR_PEP_ID=MMETSP0308-20130426/12360_1 /TAXON_ID=38269 /ORGANISM="Gloeochaete witrockiana, Strain SAG 46.84" /LENGTH=49 /DNA_ID= /DNA_START= /DNA_END= /DNA_ORIENTATION=